MRGVLFYVRSAMLFFVSRFWFDVSRLSPVNLQTSNADACGLHPDRLKPRRDLKLQTNNVVYLQVAGKYLSTSFFIAI